MARKVLSGTLMVLSFSLLVLSFIGIVASWYYNEPLTLEASSRLTAVEDELILAQTALQNAQGELARALRIVESAEESLQSFGEQRAQAKEFLDAVTGMLDETITPSLETSKEKINEAQKSIDDLSETVETLNKIPFVNLDLPDFAIFTFFADITNTLESEVDRVGDMAEQASVFLNDTSYLLGGDLLETKENIYGLMDVVDEYEGKIADWLEQLSELLSVLPGWIDRASVILTVFFLWFGFSQLGLFLHGLTSWKEGDVLLKEDDA